MTSSKFSRVSRTTVSRTTGLLLAGTMLSGVPVSAQTAAPTQAPTPTQAPGQAPAQAPARPQNSSQRAPAPARFPIPTGTPTAPATTAVPSAVPAAERIIKTLRVDGSQRIEPETALSYTKLRVGQPFSNESLDQAIRDLYASDLFADVAIDGAQTGDIVIQIRENPVINRIVFEGNKALKQDKIDKEIKLKPRQIFTRTAVQQDVGRIIELYRRQGRFAAVVEPKMVTLDQNRVDVIFEVTEGAKSKVRQINIIGNDKFDDNRLRGEMATKQSRWFRALSSGTSYDQDRLAYDQQKLRQFYLTQGYADFRVVSAVAELTPDKKDFIITYVVEEGPRYKFGDIAVDSDIRDFNNEALATGTGLKKGDWYNAKAVEDTVERLGETAGLFGYAFTDVSPDFVRNPDDLTMSITFRIAEAKRTYVERIDITGNTNTQDKVLRREIRLAEGDAFNSFQVKRSTDRINSLGYFQDKFEIKQSQGSSPDRIILEAPVEERATGSLTLSAGFSSLERFIINAGIEQRNFRGKGQTLRASVNYSTFSKSVELGFSEPYLFNKSIALGGDIFRRDFRNFNFLGNQRNTTFSQVSTGFQLRAGVPLTEYWTLIGRYGLSQDKIDLDESQFFTNGECDPLRAGSFLCEQIGTRITSSLGYSLIHDSLNSRLRPSAGQRIVLSQDFAGLGGSVKYIRSRAEARKFWGVGGGFIFSVGAEGGYIHSLEKSRGPGIDPVRINDRFYLGEPQFRGFDIRGVGPRVRRTPYTFDENGNQILVTERRQIFDNPLGGRAYYLGRAELEIPLPAGARELGLRPSIFVDAGALFGLKRPLPAANFPVDANGVVQPLVQPILDAAGRLQYNSVAEGTFGQITNCQVGFSATPGGACLGTEVNALIANTTNPFLEEFLGNSPRPRLSVGFGVNWNSPFGPLRIDIARALLKQRGEDDKLITFNVGTQF